MRASPRGHREKARAANLPCSLEPLMTINMLIDDMKQRGLQFEVPTDSLHDNAFVDVLAQAYNIGGPSNIPPDATEEAA
ncbi:hypothetical protein ACQKO5_21575 [Novosphingobium subterraneum]|uniref:hypothetical protein n=1 Tax=Novosphingobium subterraneum TaxID=48936 RepID=UPI003D0157C9